MSLAAPVPPVSPPADSAPADSALAPSAPANSEPLSPAQQSPEPASSALPSPISPNPITPEQPRSETPAPATSKADAQRPAPPVAETPLLRQLRQPLARSEQRSLLREAQSSGEGKALTLTLDAPWFELSSAQQDDLAATLWDQAQALDFERLRLVNDQGQVLARSPVVGDGMVLLRR